MKVSIKTMVDIPIIPFQCDRKGATATCTDPICSDGLYSSTDEILLSTHGRLKRQFLRQLSNSGYHRD